MGIFAQTETDLKDTVRNELLGIENEIKSIEKKASEFIIMRDAEVKNFLIFEKKKILKAFLFISWEAEEWVRHKEDLVHTSVADAENYVKEYLIKQAIKAVALVKKI